MTAGTKPMGAALHKGPAVAENSAEESVEVTGDSIPPFKVGPPRGIPRMTNGKGGEIHVAPRKVI